MILRGLDFGPVWGASGVEGFFGEGYPFHRPLHMLFQRGFSFDGMTFVAKTTTWEPRLEPEKKKGNMPLKKDGITPKEWFPACIVVKFRKGAALNSVGLSGPGAKAVLRDGARRWPHGKPFFLSFGMVGGTRKERIAELNAFIDELGSFIRTHYPIAVEGPRAPFGLQINWSCPNTGHDAPGWEELLQEIRMCLGMASMLGIPLVPKISVLFPPEIAKKISEHPACDALCVSNTIPWGSFPERIDWKDIFGSDVSPLAHLGGGGLSGAPLLLLVARWVYIAKEQSGIKKPICAGGGILSKDDISVLFMCGADAVSLGSVAFLRPWRVQSLIQYAHERFQRKN